MNHRDHKAFEEFRAVSMLHELDELRALPWPARRGDPFRNEPDFVFDAVNGKPPIGIEITQPMVPEVFKINSEIEDRVAGKKLRSLKGNDPAGKALRIVAGDPGAERTLRVHVLRSIGQAAEFYLKAIAAKKLKPAYLEGRHQLQLVLFEPKPIIQVEKGKLKSAMEKVAKSDHGDFTHIWYVNGGPHVKLLRRDGELFNFLSNEGGPA